ncbi:MAG TPA: VWA domain-containing protein [Terracidiphilus sp.]|nr:VWA domain-containing protein [Terracidiphilus sp.]
MHKLPLLLAWFCLVWFGPVFAAQVTSTTPIPAASESQPQTIHLDVLVKDKSGLLLTGLPEQAFIVRDNGLVEKLASFTPVDTKANPDAVSVLIVVDMINVDVNTVAWAREQVGEYLKQDAGKLSHPTSIAALDERGLRMMSGWTTNGNALNAGLEKMQPDLRPVNRSGGWAARDELMETSMQQFGEIVDAEQKRPGRKLVLFVSPGWPMMPNQGAFENDSSAQWCFNANVALTNEVRDARAAIYDLDTYDLGNSHHDEGAEDPFYYQSFLKPVTKWGQAQFPDLALGVFSIHSGGRVMVNGRSIIGEINDALHDAGSYYELTYAAPPASGPNQYHAVDVRVSQPGATVQTVTGYYADPQSVGPKPKKKR